MHIVDSVTPAFLEKGMSNQASKSWARASASASTSPGKWPRKVESLRLTTTKRRDTSRAALQVMADRRIEGLGFARDRLRELVKRKQAEVISQFSAQGLD